VLIFLIQNGINCNTTNISFYPSVLPLVKDSYRFLNITKILVPIPTFGYYFQQLHEEGVTPYLLPTRKEDGFLLDPEKLEFQANLTGAKALLLCYPNNPTGVVMSEENAEAIADVVKRRNLFVISDEALLRNRLSPTKKHFPIAAVNGMLDRSLTITSPAKSMGLPTRMAFCVGSEKLMNRLAQSSVGYSFRDQQIVTAAIEDNEENRVYLEEDRKAYLENIDLVKERSRQLNNRFSKVFGERSDGAAYVKPFIADPEATNVYLLDFSGLKGKIHQSRPLSTGLDIAEWLLKEASVATAPGETFAFDPNEMLVRITLNKDKKVLSQAFDNMEKASKMVTQALEHPGNSPASSSAKELADQYLKSQQTK
jgi:aspartate/methionine/tyrosine aminotransferase